MFGSRGSSGAFSQEKINLYYYPEPGPIDRFVLSEVLSIRVSAMLPCLLVMNPWRLKEKNGLRIDEYLRVGLRL